MLLLRSISCKVSHIHLKLGSPLPFSLPLTYILDHSLPSSPSSFQLCAHACPPHAHRVMRPSALLAAALKSQDMLLQPFLEQVRHEGELCFVFINGELLHAVRKDPTSWGRGARIDEDVVVPDETRSGELRTHPSVNQPVQLLRTPPSAALNIAEQAISYMQAPQGFDYASRVSL